MEKSARILVAGGTTLLGGAILSELRRRGYAHVLGGPGEPDWTSGTEAGRFFAQHRPEYVVHAAGKTAGIAGNQRYPADLIYDNLLGETHVIHNAHVHGARKLLYLASSCSYPKHCPQPMREESILTGPLEPTNEAYAIAKIAGITLCQAYRRQHGAPFVVGIPANAFGPGDDFTQESSHVVPALLRRFHEAKARGDAAVDVWGTGTPRRELVFAPDLAEACLLVLASYDADEPINLGGGPDISIARLAEAIRDVTGFTGRIRFDTARPDGMPLKRLDGTRLARLGWRPRTELRAALEATYKWYLESLEQQPRHGRNGTWRSTGP